jgi:hypothetical protein
VGFRGCALESRGWETGERHGPSRAVTRRHASDRVEIGTPGVRFPARRRPTPPIRVARRGVARRPRPGTAPAIDSIAMARSATIAMGRSDRTRPRPSRPTDRRPHDPGPSRFSHASTPFPGPTEFWPGTTTRCNGNHNGARSTAHVSSLAWIPSASFQAPNARTNRSLLLS